MKAIIANKIPKEFEDILYTLTAKYNQEKVRSLYALFRSDNILVIHALREDKTIERLEIKTANHIRIAKWKQGEHINWSVTSLSSLLHMKHRKLLATLGFLNYFIFQWFFTRLTVRMDEQENILSFFFKFEYPMTKWNSPRSV